MVVLRKTKFITKDGHCVELYADSIDELMTATPPMVVGLAKNTKIMPSSFCFDSDGRKSVYTSSGTWKELKDGGTEDDQIVNALKDYYVSIGGNAEDVESITTIYDMIEAISAISGSGLPDVDTEDDGDVLTVVNGMWDKSDVATFQLFGTNNSGQVTISGVSTWDQLISLINKGYTTLIVNNSYYELMYLDNSLASFAVYDMNPIAKTLTRQIIKFVKGSGQFKGIYDICTMNFAN